MDLLLALLDTVFVLVAQFHVDAIKLDFVIVSQGDIQLTLCHLQLLVQNWCYDSRQSLPLDNLVLHLSLLDCLVLTRLIHIHELLMCRSLLGLVSAGLSLKTASSCHSPC